MLDEEKMKDEVKEEAKPNVEPVPAQEEPETPVSPVEEPVAGETRTPSEVPVMNTEPQPTAEQIEEAQIESDENVEEEVEKTLTQSQVNELIGNTRTETRDKTRAEVMQEFYNRYGVSGDDELNDIFGRGQNYDILNDNYTMQGNQLRDVLAENALLKSGISESRWGDAKAILASKGLEVNQENILSELVTHPEWKAVPSMEAGVTSQALTPQMAEQMVANQRGPMEPHNGTPSVIKKLGDNGEVLSNAETEDARMKRLFNL